MLRLAKAPSQRNSIRAASWPSHSASHCRRSNQRSMALMADVEESLGGRRYIGLFGSLVWGIIELPFVAKSAVDGRALRSSEWGARPFVQRN